MVFLPERVDDSFRLSVGGEVARSDSQNPLPVLRVADVVSTGSLLDIYREDAVQVELVASAPRPTSEAQPATPPKWRAWPVASLRLAAEEAPPELKVTANSPSFSAVTLSAYRATEEAIIGNWTAEVVVESGNLAALRIEMPPTGSGSGSLPQQVECLRPADAKLIKLPNTEPAAWELQLPAPRQAGDKLLIELLTPFAIKTSGNTTAPSFLLPQAKTEAQYVALPSPASANEDAPLRWAALSMSRVINAKNVAQLLPEGFSWQLRKVLADGERKPGRPASVFWTAAPGREGPLRVPLAEYHVAAHRDIERLVTSKFFIQPNGAKSCVLHLGKDHQLQSLSINGTVTPHDEQTPGKWLVELRSPVAPQLLQTTVSLPRNSMQWQPQRLTDPRRGGVRVDKVLWSIESNDRVAFEAPPDGRRLVPRMGAVIRLRELMDLGQGFDTPSPAWLKSWLPLVEKAARQVQAGYTGGESLSDFYSPDNLARQGSSTSPAGLAAQGLSWVRSQRPPSNGATEDSSPTTLAHGSQEEYRKAYFVVNAPKEMVSPAIFVVDDGRVYRWLAALALVAIAIGTRRRVARINLLALSYEHRHLLVALGGVFWWMLMQPSVVGLMLLVASAVGQVRRIVRPTVFVTKRYRHGA